MTEAEDTQQIRDAGDAKHEDTIKGYLKLILWATCLLIVVGFVSVIRSFTLQAHVDDLDTHTKELRQETDAAKDAAVEARDALLEALSRTPSNNPDAIAHALEAVHRIENQLCGGPCEHTTGR